MPQARRKPTRGRRLSPVPPPRVARTKEERLGKVVAEVTPRPSSVGRAVGTLRRGREALSEIEGQLDSLMEALREPGRRLDAAAPDRLAGAARRADKAMAAIDRLRDDLFA